MVFPALCVFAEALKNAVITNESEHAEKRFERNENKFVGRPLWSPGLQSFRETRSLLGWC
ncbi:hypothetical protein SD53_06955 [Rheinheimera mesophila]|nr:hypothetical protein SD53_06955 [Rheinheimera mesophila]